MGRLLIFLGVILLIAGFVIPFASSFSGFGGFGDFMSGVNDAINPTAEELCNPGETLDIVQGASTRTGSSSTSFGRPTQFYCVNNDGERRDVTLNFANDAITDATSGIGGMLTGIVGTFALSGAGVVLLILGIILSARKRSRALGYGSPVMVGRGTVGVQGQYTNPVMPQQPQQGGWANLGSDQMMHSKGDMVDFIRKQLDAAYQSGQISREDYDAAIDKLRRQ